MNQDTPATKLVPMISASSEAPRKNHGTVPEGVCLCWFSQRPQWVYRALMTTARGNVSKIFQKENPENSSHSFWAQLHSKSANLIHLCQLESSFPVSRITLSQVALTPGTFIQPITWEFQGFGVPHVFHCREGVSNKIGPWRNLLSKWS